jgi:hypothetical protein
MTPDYSVDTALKKDGFIRHRFDCKSMSWIPSSEGYYSTMGDIEFKWVKDNVTVHNGLNGTDVIVNGITIHLKQLPSV